MAITQEDVLEFLENATILQVSDLVKAIEEKFGVSAAAAVAVAPAAGGAGGGDEADAGPTSVTVTLTGPGDNKIGVIKVVKEITGLGLKEAKALVDGAPSPIKEDIEPSEADELKAKLEEAGASVEVK